MISITLPDGSVKQFDAGITPMGVAISISEGFARNVISASFNDIIIESSTPLTEDGHLILYTWRDKKGKQAFWHSSAHIMAQALEEKFPGVKLTIGPAIENGFYYDIDLVENTISDKSIFLINNLEKNKEHFDTIYCLEVLEHFREEYQLKLIKEIKSKLQENGKIVVALIDNHEATLKRYRKKSNAIALESANPAYETRIFGPERIKIQGVLSSLYRNF